jgi:hypothetical protein
LSLSLDAFFTLEPSAFSFFSRLSLQLLAFFRLLQKYHKNKNFSSLVVFCLTQHLVV